MWHLLRNRRIVAAAASALTLQISCSHANAAALSGSPPSLRNIHEALITGPAGRKYAKASHLGGSLWELVFSTQDLRTKVRTAQSQIMDLDRDQGGSMTATIAADGGTAITRSVHHGLEFRQAACEDGKKLAVEIWNSAGVRLAHRVIDGVGPKVLPGGVFGQPRFSPSGRKVTWVAERQPAGASASGYWPRATPAAGNKGGGAAKEEDGKGTAEDGGMLAGKYALRDQRSTGEALLVHSAQVCAWDWMDDAVCVLAGEEIVPPPGQNEVIIPTQPCFDGTDEGLIVACHVLPPWQPGISACLNRPTGLYHLQDLWPAQQQHPASPTGGDEATAGGVDPPPDPPKKRSPARCLTPSLYFAHMPRLSPDGATLAFAARPDEFKSHSAALELRTMPWPPPPDLADAGEKNQGPPSNVLVPIVTGPPPTTDGSSFAGVFGFHDEIASLTWLEDGQNSLVFHSIAGATKTTFTISTRDTGGGASAVLPLRPPQCEEGSVELLGASQGTVIVQCSSMRAPPTVWAHTDGLWRCLVDTSQLVADQPNAEVAREALSKLRAARAERVVLPADKGGAEALCLLPAGEQEGGVPWVLKVHGGPHSASLDAFNVEVALLALGGVAVLQPNYRGSLGYGDAFCAALPGHIGEMDVADCVALTRACLEQLPAALDPARGAAYGGSHGGFLTAWLLGCDDRALYSRGGVLWNPVVDLVAMLGTTDIPEWVSAEGLSGDASRASATWPLSVDALGELYARSPLSVIDRVEAPALMLLGAADQRVPHKQGRSWVSALQQVRARNGGRADVTALEFPGEGHSIASLEGNAHAQQSAVAWLVERLGAKTK